MSKLRWGWMVLLLLGLQPQAMADPVMPNLPDAAHTALEAGNFKDAYAGYYQMAIAPDADPSSVFSDLSLGTECLARLGRENETDAFREAVVAAHPNSWRVLWAAARNLYLDQHYGFIIAGKFSRGSQRGNDGRYVSSYERDRVRALQWMQEAMSKPGVDVAGAANAQFFTDFAELIMSGRDSGASWRLQYLTDLTTLPDYNDGYNGWRWNGSGTHAAPVDDQGNPVFYHIPATFEASTDDGERWRWLLIQAGDLGGPSVMQKSNLSLAIFLRDQFDVQTLASYGPLFNRLGSDSASKAGPYTVSTLGEDETMAQLASGVKRFKLPNEFNFIHIFQQIADQSRDSTGQAALDALTQTFENRQQYDRAAFYLQSLIGRYGDGPNHYQQHRLDQILKPWGEFQPLSTQPAGRTATLQFRFRNGTKVSFDAYSVRVNKLLADTLNYLSGHPAKLDWNKVRVEDVGYLLVNNHEDQYLGDKVASWTQTLIPREGHFDRIVAVPTPLKQAGAYLVRAQMENGNTVQSVVWLADMVLARKPTSDGTLCMVMDAVTGKPVPNASIEMFGYRQQWKQGKDYELTTISKMAQTNADGLARLKLSDDEASYTWLTTASAPGGQLAYEGFSYAWYGGVQAADLNQTRAMVITDRPIYRPGQAMKFKCWVGQAKFDGGDANPFVGQRFTVSVSDPRGDNIYKKELQADSFGGFDGEVSLDAAGSLGIYSIVVTQGDASYGTATFRVEEYRKPEFEVTVDAPAQPVLLGGKVTAIIHANYYFGAPVREAMVKYKVLRSAYSANWYPPGRWDWYYQPGYWWFASNATWYPGWQDWGISRPWQPWWGNRQEQPEVVADNEAAIGPDGTLKVEIDTALARAIHGDTSQRYTITAEVTDRSRRTVVGTGYVTAALKPFQVYTWVDRGYYQAGDTVKAQFIAQTLDNKSVHGQAVVKLLKVVYDNAGTPVETLVRRWPVELDREGGGSLEFKVEKSGQYRLSCSVADMHGATVTGGYLFTVRGEVENARNFRFNDLELVPDRREYKPGDSVKLAVNTDYPNSTVALFIRPENGVYDTPQILNLTGESTTVQIPVKRSDMPNFFVEGLTVHDGQIFTEVHEVVVPPEDRILNVSVTPSSAVYKPGQSAKMTVRITDGEGVPVVGSAALSVYDRALDAVAGGSNLPDIRTYFWQWIRSHHPFTTSSVSQQSYNLTDSENQRMLNLGVFGYATADQDRMAGLRGMNGAIERQSDAAGFPLAPAAGIFRMDQQFGNTKALGQAAAQAGGGGGAGGVPALVEPSVRSNFADSALWVANLLTDRTGMAQAVLTMPDNLTSWKTSVWAMGPGARVGQGMAEVVTSKNLLVRLEAPRFFVQKDEVIVTVIVHNYLKTRKRVRVDLTLDGPVLSAGSDPVSHWVTIDPNGEAQVDFNLKVQSQGLAVIQASARTDEESDAMELKIPSYIHGASRTQPYTGVIKSQDNRATLSINVPEDRIPEQSLLEVRYSPSAASAMVDALPYLISSPYTSTEETINRFLPLVLTQKTLTEMGIDLKTVQQRLAEVKPANFTHTPWSTGETQAPAPVFDSVAAQRLARENLQYLQQIQLTDGGWGWFSGWGEQSLPDMTATVVHGLQLASQTGIQIPQAMVGRGVEWLKQYQARSVQTLKNAPSQTDPYKLKADNMDALVYRTLADVGVVSPEMQDFLYRDRQYLSAYGKALFGLGLVRSGDKEKLAMVLQNLSQYLVQDDENGAAYLKLPPEGWWRWYASDTDANAAYLSLLSRTDPKGELASKLARYLINNRSHATYWNSTRDSANCIEALADYLKASGESKPDMKITLAMDGKQMKEVTVNAGNLFTFDNQFSIAGDALTSGPHTIEIQKIGSGPLYYNASLTNFTLEDPIRAAGLEIKVQRKFYKLIPANHTIKTTGSHGQVVDQQVEKYDRQEIPNLGSVHTGDLVEVELEIDSKNDYEYLKIEDMKAAGFEPLETHSGYNGNDMGAYMELRDNRVVFFVRELARGKHSVSYRLRAETPGLFSALPTRITGVYTPDLKANSDENKVRILQ